MKSAALLPALLFTAVAGISPQQQSFEAGQMEGLGPQQKQLQAAARNCPIAMSARQGGGLHVERAQGGELPSGPFMTPSLTLGNPQGKRIVSASVTALGFGANQGTTLLQTGDAVLRSNPNPKRPRLSRSQTVELTPDNESKTYVSGELYLPGFIVLDSIALNSVIFADGSTQSFASDSGCRATPSPLMLVSDGFK